MEEKRIYVVIAGTVQVPVSVLTHKLASGAVHYAPDYRKGMRTVVQVPGRQIAQACHVVSKLRHQVDPLTAPSKSGQILQYRAKFEPMTTIILQARDSAELMHNFSLLSKKKLNPVFFNDTNEQVYGLGEHTTAVAALAYPTQVVGILDYLPLWGAQ